MVFKLLENNSIGLFNGRATSDIFSMGLGFGKVDLDIIKKYNELIISGKEYTTEFGSAVESVLNPTTAFYSALSDGEGNIRKCSKATEDLILSANGAAISEEVMAQAANQVGASSIAASIGVKALNIALNALIGIGIALALSAIAKGIDYVINYSENLKKKVNELKKEYTGLQSEIESINDELKTNGDRIRQLLALESLTYVETAELEKLKEVNAEIERTLKIKQDIARSTQKDNENTAVKSYKNSFSGVDSFGIKYNSAVEYIQGYIHILTLMQEEIDKLEEKGSSLSSYEKSELNRKKKIYDSTRANLNKYALDIDELSQSMYDISDPAIKAKADINSALNMVADFIDGIDVVPAKVKAALEQFSYSFEKYSKKELITAGIGIEIDQEEFNGVETAYKILGNIAASYGYTVEELIDICEHFGYIQGSVADSLGQSGGAFADQINSIKEASIAYNLLMNEYTSTGEISYETYRKVIAGNEDLKDSFQSINGVLKLDIDALKEWISAKRSDVEQTMIQQSATKEQVSEMLAMIDVIEQSIKAYSSSMAIRNEFVEEFNQNGEVSYETYQKLIQSGSEYADVVEKVNGKYKVNVDKLNSLDEATRKALEDTLALYGATEKQINSAGKLTPTNENLTQSYSEIVSELSTLMGWMEKVNEGYEFSAIEILNLIEKYPELASAISITANGYTLEAEALRKVIDLKAQNLKLSAQSAVIDTSKTVVSYSNNQATVDNTLALINDDMKTYDDWLESWRKKWDYGSDVTPDITGIKELVEAAINERAMQKAIDTIINDVVTSASTGSLKQGYDPTKKASKGETEFSKQLKQLKYEKEAFEANMKIGDGVYDITSAEDYYTALQALAKTAYENGEIDLNEYREYVLEAYKGLSKDFNMFEKQLKQLQYEKNALDAGMKITDGEYNLKSAEDYYNALSELSRIAYESNEIDIAQYRDYVLECYKNLMKAEEEYFNTTIETSEFKIYQLNRERDAEQKQIDAYINMQEMILAKKNEYIQKGYDLTSDEIRNLESAYESFGERVANIMAGSVDQKLIEEYTGILDTLTQKRQWYLQNGYDETSTELRNLQKEYDSFADAMVNTMESAAKRIASAQKSAIDQVVSSMRSATSAMNIVLDTVVDYIKREKDAEKSALQDQISALKSGYSDAKKNIGKYYDDLISAAKESYSTQKEEADKYFNGILDAAKKAYEAQKNHLSNLLDSYKRIIDAQKESLKTAQETEKYHREVVNKNKNITTMKNTLAALENDDTKGAEAKRLELIEKIKKAEEDLSDYQNDYALNNTLTALDKEYKAYEDTIKAQQELLEQQYNSMKELYQAQKEAHIEMLEANNKATLSSLEAEKEYRLEAMESQHNAEVAALEQKIADIDEYLKKEGNLRRDANALIEKEGQELWDKLMEYEYEYSKDITSLQEAWVIANGAMAEYSNGQFNILNTMREMNAQMDILIAKSNALANIDSYVSTMKQNSQNWHISDTSTQTALHDQNVAMGTALGAEFKNGVWYLNGKPLYTFHTGAEKGFVLNDPKIKKNEVLAKLAAGEIVLTPNQLDHLGAETYQAGLERMAQLQAQSSSFSMEVNFNGNVSEKSLPKINATIKKATDTILDEVEKRNSRRGTKPPRRTY